MSGRSRGSAEEEFGQHLRDLRLARGWRQSDLVTALGGRLARSTIANVEAGREAPSERLWAALTDHAPDLAELLFPEYQAARAAVAGRTSGPRRRTALKQAFGLGGEVVVEHLSLVYVFRESLAPEEILEVRRVRALRQGADRFGFKLGSNATDGFEVESEALWGGQLVEECLQGEKQTVYLRDVRFDRPLRRGEVHEFAIRTWVQRDPEPSSEVTFRFTVPAESVSVQLNFYGSKRPTQAWSFGPLADDLQVTRTPDPSRDLEIGETGTVAARFSTPGAGMTYGIAWSW